jgi:predicted nucleotidyltransferase
LTSSVLKWPDAEKVADALRRWAKKAVQQRPEVLQIGYFGSYARGDWGVGSDLDLIIILKNSEKTFDMRASEWDTADIPVPTDVLVYTQEEWQKRPGFLSPRLTAEIVWVPLS